eukprot:CAMPEP_0170177302 /NCGR_PEP_ID=MMETSP0040_2-20121228/9977_1 /TAXON_ID=641309 /ORGANISM="Lotharella oceanica, Strain CCMP622" /LENGTH=281 /DNA_ID=CAMNT_0010419897 /DNA_START=47 /DNA_END=892 /DNA_ORIENTATION=+
MGFVLTLIFAREMFNVTNDDDLLLFGIAAALVLGTTTSQVVWIAHGLVATVACGLSVYGIMKSYPYFLNKFGPHWWLWGVAVLCLLPIVILAWRLYRTLAFLAKTALGALLVTAGVEYFLTAYTDILNPNFHILHLVDGTNPDCHSATCVATITFWVLLAVMGSFVHNFGMEMRPYRSDTQEGYPSQRRNRPGNPFATKRDYGYQRDAKRRSPLGHVVAEPVEPGPGHGGNGNGNGNSGSIGAGERDSIVQAASVQAGYRSVESGEPEGTVYGGPPFTVDS